MFNENGKDVTPKPLTALKPTVLHDKLLSISGHSPQGDDFDHSAPICRSSPYVHLLHLSGFGLNWLPLHVFIKFVSGVA